MKRRDPTEEALDALAELRRASDPEASAQRLKAFLGNRSNLVVAKAAKIAGETRSAGLIPDLLAAFDRLMGNPTKLDKGCAAATAIVEALYAMDYGSADVYFRGARHVQLEASFGPPVDAAIQLRAASAMGLVRTRHPDALFEVVRLLADKEPRVRMAAARALGTVAAETGELLLLLKILTGDEEPEVMGECFAGILASETERSLALVAAYLDDADPAVAEAAVLALGACRQPRALDLLREKWERTAHGPMRKTLLLAFATARQEPALEFLLSLAAGAEPRVAAEVIGALRVCRNETRVREALSETLRKRGDDGLIEAFAAEFGR